MPKSLSAVVAIVLLLMMTVGAAGMAYIFTTGLQTKTQESATGGVQSLQEATSSCMSVDSVYGNKVYLKNCGSGVITGASLIVYMDGAPINATMSPAVISKGEVGAVNLSGIWALSYDKHTLKIENGLAQVMQRVVAEPRKDDAAGIWRFDEGSGTTAYDGSGNGNVGTLINNPTWTGGKFGKGLQFNGVNQYVNVPNSASLNPTTAVTMTAWVKLNSVGNRWIIGKEPVNSAYELFAEGTQFVIRINLCCSNNVYGGTQQAGVWTHVAGTYDGANIRLYINGNLIGNPFPYASSILTTSSPLQIGAFGSGTYYQMDGIIDEVRIYSKALTPDETVNLRAA